MNLSKADLKHEQLAQMLSFNKKTTIANIMVAGLMCVELWSVVPRWAVLSWLAATLLITGARCVLSYHYQTNPTKSEALTANRLKWFRVGVMLSALVWGLSAWLVYGHEIDKYELFVAYMIAGISAATAIDYLIDLVSALSYLILAVIPMVLMFMLSQDSVLMIMGAAAAGYLLFTGTSMKAFNLRLHEGVRLRREAEHLAFYDSLTGLPNRRLLLDRIEVALLQSVRQNKPLAVLFLDLDHFKAVNDQYGHQVGDLLLQAFAKRLTEFTRQSDTVARLAGDEFVILIENLQQEAILEPIDKQVKQFAQKLFAHLEMPYQIGDQLSYVAKPSIGVAISNHPNNTNALALIKHADDAMYQAKKTSEVSVRIYGASDYEGKEAEAHESIDITVLPLGKTNLRFN